MGRRKSLKIRAVFTLALFACSMAIVTQSATAASVTGDITFSSGGNSTPFNVYTIRADGTGRTQLTFGSGTTYNYASAYSPNGTQIVWTRHDTTASTADLWVMNADGSNKTQITNTPGAFREFQPDWSPDGSKIVFYTQGDDVNNDIYVINSDGTGLTRLTTAGQDDVDPRWSPNGSKIVWAHGNNARDIWVMNADGSGKAQLTNNAGNIQDRNPSWSPDGTKILWSSDRSGTSELYTMNPDGTGVTRITNNGFGEFIPTWNPGTKVTFTLGTALFDMNPDGTGLDRLTNGGSVWDFWPERSPVDAAVTFPGTTIDSGPSGTITTNDVTFHFSSDEAGTTFQCSMDGSSFLLTPCTSPFDYTDLAEGVHTFEVRATDGDGNVDPSAASRTFTVDTVAPETTIDSGVWGWTNDDDPSFEFSADDVNATFECSLDGAPFAGCSTPADLTDLADGNHTFEVRALDEFGNTDQTPASNSFSVDTQAPDTSISEGPTGTINVEAATFEFSSLEGIAFECSLDSAAFTTCTSPIDYTDLDEGDHRFDVRAIDAADNVDPDPAFRTFHVDTVPPGAPTIDGGPTGPTNDASPSFEFSTSDATDTFECSLNGAPFTSCTSPEGHSGLTEGDHTFDVKATDQAGNTGEPTHVTFSVDLTLPGMPTIEDAPDGQIDYNDVTFEFSSLDPTDTFECSLDGAVWTACSSPQDYDNLPDGSHTVGIRVIDAAGNAGDSEVIAFDVDTIAPVTEIDSGPGSITNVPTAVFELDSDEPATFECRIDGGTWGTCPATATVPSLADGEHTFEARATDVVGNQDQTPASYTFTVDTAPPAMPVIDEGPSGLIAFNDVTFGFSSTEPGVEFQCALDGGFVDCSSTWQYNDLDEGSHTFQVRAEDDAGNAGAPASRSFTIDTVPPDAPSIDSGPSGTINSNSTSFAFSASDATAFNCRMDSGTFTNCSSGVGYNGLAEGGHTFEVYAVDGAGNEGPSQSVSFSVDTIAPGIASITDAPSGTIITDSTSVSFTSGDDQDTFECELDGGGYEECSSAQNYTGLSEGDHTISVRAVDTAGNPGPSSTVNFTVDTIAPGSVTITDGPENLINESTVAIEFESSVSDDTFECSVDGASFVACSSGEILSGLSEGGHDVDIRTTDSSGRVGPVTSVDFTVDTVPPGVVTIQGAPDETVNEDEVTLSFSTGDPSDNFQCSVDGDDYFDCNSPSTFNDLDDGGHTIFVVAIDDAGNVGPVASASFAVDVENPGGGVVEPDPEPSNEPDPDPEPEPSSEPEPQPTGEPIPETGPEPNPPDDGSPQHNGKELKPGDGRGGDGSGTSEPEPENAPDPGPVTEGVQEPSTTEAPTWSTESPNKVIDLRSLFGKDGKKRDGRRQEAEDKKADEKDAAGAAAETEKMRLRNRRDRAEQLVMAEWQVLAKKTAETLAFPLALTILVILYLLTQYWMDRSDPKLAVAPVNAKYDVVRFE